MRDTLYKMHALGAGNPTSDQLRVLGKNAILTALAQTPWAKEFEHLAPGQRHTFTGLGKGWADAVERNITLRLGEDAKELPKWPYQTDFGNNKNSKRLAASPEQP